MKYQCLYSITYVISTKNKDNFFVDANSGDLRIFYIDDGLSLEEVEKCTSSREDILEQAKIKMKEYGYGDEYKISYVNCNNSDDEEKAYMWYITFAKEYDGIFNEYQSVTMTIIPKINKVTQLSIKNEPFDNNEIKITNGLISVNKKESSLPPEEIEKVFYDGIYQSIVIDHTL